MSQSPGGSSGPPKGQHTPMKVDWQAKNKAAVAEASQLSAERKAAANASNVPIFKRTRGVKRAVPPTDRRTRSTSVSSNEGDPPREPVTEKVVPKPPIIEEPEDDDVFLMEQDHPPRSPERPPPGATPPTTLEHSPEASTSGAKQASMFKELVFPDGDISPKMTARQTTDTDQPEDKGAKWSNRPTPAQVTLPIMMAAMGYRLRPWMIVALCGQNTTVANYQSEDWAGWVSPADWLPNRKPEKPCTLVPVRAVQCLFGKDPQNKWVPCPYAYKLPLLAEVAKPLLPYVCQPPPGRMFSRLMSAQNDILSWMGTHLRGDLADAPKHLVPHMGSEHMLFWSRLTYQNVTFPVVHRVSDSCAVLGEEVVRSVFDMPITPPDQLAALLDNPHDREQQPQQPELPVKKVRKVVSTAVLAGKRTVEARDVLAIPLAEVASPADGKFPDTFVELVGQQANAVGGLAINHNIEDQLYEITCTIPTMTVPGLNPNVLNPTIILGDKIDPRMPHTPLAVQWTAGRQVVISELSQWKSVLSDNQQISGKKMQEACPSLLMQQGFRVEHNAQMANPTIKRANLKGLFTKLFLLAHQTSRAAAENMGLVLVGLGVNPLQVIQSPMNDGGANQVVDQVATSGLAFIVPDDISAPEHMTIAAMAAVGGQVLAIQGVHPISVVDSIVWPATVGFVLCVNGVVAPIMAQIPPSANAIVNFAQHYANNVGASEELMCGFFDALTIVGATWAIVPDAPIAALNIPYVEQPEEHAFDRLQHIPADDPRRLGPNPEIVEHPQAAHDVDLYTHDGRPVVCRAVPQLPTQEFISILYLVRPQCMGFIQRLVGAFTPDDRAQFMFSATIMSQSARVSGPD